MNDRILIVMPGEAQTKSNKTFFRRGHVYIPEDIVEWEHSLSAVAAAVMAGRPPYMVPVTVLVRMYRGSKRKCDLGNYQKSAMDALNGIVYEDDYLICHLDMWKFYDPSNPRLEIEVIPYDGPPEIPLPIVLPEDRAPKREATPRAQQRQRARRNNKRGVRKNKPKR